MQTHSEFPNLFVVDHPLIQHKLSHMRDRTRSTMGFRTLLREIALLMGYEITRDLRLPTAEEFSTDVLIRLAYENPAIDFKMRVLEIQKARVVDGPVAT